MFGYFEYVGSSGGSVRALFFVVVMSAVAPQQSTGQAPAGELQKRVRSSFDRSQEYALYLPPGYTPEREWPILFVLDPRGRAVLALQLFREGAARLGWVVMSSYNSRSDSLAELNDAAMEAMLRSAQDGISIDRSRLYIAGFSGTARAALLFAVTLRGHVAGVIAAGGALGFELGGPEAIFAGDSTFAYFGGAGMHDFNYEEVVAMAGRFGTMKIPYRLAAFPGPHNWPPADICGEAMEWLELRAMRAGRRPTDTAWVRTRLEADLARAAALERAGRLDEALQQYEAITRDYLPSPATSRAVERAAALRNNSAVKRHRAEARKLAEKDLAQARDLQKVLAGARSSSRSPEPDDLLKKLKIAKLKEQSKRGDSLQAASAERLLNRTFVFLAYYEPRSYLAQKSADRALAMLEAATAIAPLQGESCTMLHAALRATGAKHPAPLNVKCPPPAGQAR
jgi:predicted esterase